MTQTRRSFLHTAIAATGAVVLLPYAARAAAHGADVFETPAGAITIHPVDHASFVAETPVGVIYNDPVGDPANYADFAEPDLIVITHEHGDHLNVETLNALVGEKTRLITNPAVHDMLPDALKAKTDAIGNGGQAVFRDMTIDAIPAYNLTEDRQKFHPQGRDNGYVLSLEGFRMYISGDTEDVPEMRGLQNIDLAFVCMNLPFTMDAKAAASAVSEFAPKFVYPYHYRGRDGGTQDPAAFASMLAGETEVKMGNWY